MTKYKVKNLKKEDGSSYSYSTIKKVEEEAELEEAPTYVPGFMGADGKPIYREDGKILKGENYSPPNVSQYLPDDNQMELPFE